MRQCVNEIDQKMPPLAEDESAYSITDAEASLPFLRNCIKENFRITPVFTMPLARRVLKREGIVIAGNHIPYMVSAKHLILLHHFVCLNNTDVYNYIDIHRCLQSCIPPQPRYLG